MRKEMSVLSPQLCASPHTGVPSGGWGVGRPGRLECEEPTAEHSREQMVRLMCCQRGRRLVGCGKPRVQVGSCLGPPRLSDLTGSIPSPSNVCGVSDPAG